MSKRLSDNDKVRTPKLWQQKGKGYFFILEKSVGTILAK